MVVLLELILYLHICKKSKGSQQITFQKSRIILYQVNIFVSAFHNHDSEQRFPQQDVESSEFRKI